MEMLRGLGVNSTVGIQLVIFLVGYAFLYFALFKPYFRAYAERVDRTMGRAELAERYIAESTALQAEYETKARELSSQYKSIFDESRSQALREYDRVVSEARLAAKAQLENAKQKIRSELENANNQLQKEIPAVAEAITSRLLGKDMLQ